MRAFDTKYCNMWLAPPREGDTEDTTVQHLPCLRTVIDGVPMVISWWKPTLAERLRLIAGAGIRLSQRGRTVAPLVIEVDPDHAVEVDRPNAPKRDAV